MIDADLIAALIAARAAKDKAKFTALFEFAGGWEGILPKFLELLQGGTVKPKRVRPVQIAMDGLDGFDAFYQIFPIHKGRRAAERAYQAALKRGRRPEEILGAARLYAAEMAGTDPQFIKHPATWLNADCMTDEISSARPSHLSLVPANYAPPRTLADAVRRLEIFYGLEPSCPKGAWTDSWAGKPPPEPTDQIPVGCLISPEAFVAFLVKHGQKSAAAG